VEGEKIEPGRGSRERERYFRVEETRFDNGTDRKKEKY